ncbi:S-adenosyl-L-methionine-dependent methyltransferase [Aspergillus transmontanensis]|uniref:tRNA wybutosine-synthesizing protein 2 n=1 Tax=Aspergillus transmontanensis TaxID=1034304 RepID=A0A5N6W2I9_9EURO|nr:S-adenosyl-L-methionine-dependent methyltransferase [Aspergillus transmontanensis]
MNQETTTTTPSLQPPTTKKPSRHEKGSKKAPQKTFNPLQIGIQDFMINNISPETLSQYGLSSETLHSSLPKRFTVYEPMLLLPVNAFSSPPAWSALYQSLTAPQQQTLYASLAKAFSRMGVTHVAINAPIALTDTQGQENRMRSPAGLVPLYGDFGPLPPAAGPVSSSAGEEGQPSDEDLEQAFWVRTMQNHGIVQIWAPLYTMFSRGNVTEKARVLGHGASPFEGLEVGQLGGQAVSDVGVVDMYAGIGYFVFSYLKRGVRRVWGWEINGWSVEGLRRGCEANGWGCRVVRVREDGGLNEGLLDLVGSLKDTDRVVLFHGDNRFAADILREIRRVMEEKGEWNRIRHVNLGLLPTSVDAWGNACRMVDAELGGWVHVHENVDLREIEQKKEDITVELGRLRAEALGLQDTVASAECRHVEQVKTYAPGVMHCVYDMKLLACSELQQKTAG